MIGTGRGLETRQVTGDTGGVRAGQRVVVVDMALRALQRGVGAGQGKAGAGVVKAGSRPRCGVMALIAGLREV